MPSSIVSFPRTDDGKPMIPGRAKHTVTHDFAWASSVPGSLTQTGTCSIVGNNGSKALRMQVATAQAGVALAETVDLSDVNLQAVTLTVRGMRYPSSGWPSDLYLMCEGTGTIGGNWRRTNMSLNGRTGDGLISCPITTAFGGKVATTSLTFVMLPRRKVLALLSGDQVINAGYFPTLDVSGVGTPKLLASGSAGNYIDVSQIELATYTD